MTLKAQHWWISARLLGWAFRKLRPRLAFAWRRRNALNFQRLLRMSYAPQGPALFNQRSLLFDVLGLEPMSQAEGDRIRQSPIGDRH